MHPTTVISERLKAEFQLVRWPNLVMLAGIQVLAFITLVLPELPADTPKKIFFLAWIVLMTTSAAAGGYMLNDLMDRAADLKNGRKNVFNAGTLSPDRALRQYLFLLFLGLTFTVNLSAWSLHFLWLFPLVVFFLWAYSKYLKRLPFIGNVAVSAFCAGAIGILWAPAQPLSVIPRELIWLTVFAFLLTLIREIVKDMEDIRGDREVGDRTLPIVAGIPGSIILVTILQLAVVAALLYPSIRPATKDIAALGFWFLTQILMITALLYLIMKAREQVGFHRISLLLKFAMLSGTLFIML